MQVGKVFKVRSKKTGLFSTGSRNGYMRFSKNGKAWSNIGHVKSMLRQFDKGNTYLHYMGGHTFDDLEIVTYEVNETETVNVTDLVSPNKS